MGPKPDLVHFGALRRTLVAGCALAAIGAPIGLPAQPARVYRIGVVSMGGSYAKALEGLRDGLGALNMVEGQNFVLDVRDVQGDFGAVGAAAKNLEDARVDLIYAVATSVAQEVKRATRSVPIVFYAGSDPVAFNLVESFAKPGGRLTGIHGLFTDLTGKRLQLLRDLVPTARRIVTFYNPRNPSAQQSINAAREAAKSLKLVLLERQVASVGDLRQAVGALGTGDADAFCYVADAMVNSQSQLVIDGANARRLPTMFATPDNAASGALASYGASYYDFGRLSARHVQRVLTGTPPKDLPIEQIDKLHFAVNLATARTLGLSISASVLARADQIIQ